EAAAHHARAAEAVRTVSHRVDAGLVRRHRAAGVAGSSGRGEGFDLQPVDLELLHARSLGEMGGWLRGSNDRNEVSGNAQPTGWLALPTGRMTTRTEGKDAMTDAALQLETGSEAPAVRLW